MDRRCPPNIFGFPEDDRCAYFECFCLFRLPLTADHAMGLLLLLLLVNFHAIVGAPCCDTRWGVRRVQYMGKANAMDGPQNMALNIICYSVVFAVFRVHPSVALKVWEPNSVTELWH